MLWDQGFTGSTLLFVITVIQSDVTNWQEHLGCLHCSGGPAVPFLGLLWHLSPSARRYRWKQKLLSSFQTQSGALWASAGKTGSTSLAAVALASCLPWIGTSVGCSSLWAGLSRRPQAQVLKSVRVQLLSGKGSASVTNHHLVITDMFAVVIFCLL